MLFLPSFTEILFYGKTFSLIDTWAEVELPATEVTSFFCISFLPLVPTLRSRASVQEKKISSPSSMVLNTCT